MDIKPRKTLSLIRKQTEIDFEINSPMIQQHDEIKNMYVDDEGKIKHIYENISIKELDNPMYNNSIVFYNNEIKLDENAVQIKSDLTEELYQIIETYNYIPQKIKNDKCQSGKHL